MALSTLTTEHFFAVVGRTLDPENVRDVEVSDALKRSEAIILAYTSSNGNPVNGVWVDSICAAIQFDMINRVYTNPHGKASEAMGPENQSFTAPGGLFLLPAERDALDKLKTSQGGGLKSVRTFRGDYSSFGYWF